MRHKPTSIESAVAALRAAAADLPSPPSQAPLRDGDMHYWRPVMTARHRDEWTDLDLVIASNLCRCMGDIASEQATLDAEGYIVSTERGGQKMNPRALAVDVLIRRKMMLMRSLRMAGRAAGDPRDQAGRRQAQRQAARALDVIGADDLLAH